MILLNIYIFFLTQLMSERAFKPKLLVWTRGEPRQRVGKQSDLLRSAPAAPARKTGQLRGSWAWGWSSCCWHPPWVVQAAIKPLSLGELAEKCNDAKWNRC